MSELIFPNKVPPAVERDIKLMLARIADLERKVAELEQNKADRAGRKKSA